VFLLTASYHCFELSLKKVGVKEMKRPWSGWGKNEQSDERVQLRTPQLKNIFGGIRRGKNGDNGDRTHDIMQIPGLASVQSMRATAAPYPPNGNVIG
jgi:hypothetical protein